MKIFHPILCAALMLAGASSLALTATCALAQNAQSLQRLNPNTATAAQLKSVTGLDDALIADIQKGKPFATMGDFHKVVSAKRNVDQAKQIYTSLFVPVNLNSASRDDITLIPGMTPRMVREFLEYRPYSDMAQFNREIGKYVDAAEVARLASYVTLK